MPLCESYESQDNNGSKKFTISLGENILLNKVIKYVSDKISRDGYEYFVQNANVSKIGNQVENTILLKNGKYIFGERSESKNCDEQRKPASNIRAASKRNKKSENTKKSDERPPLDILGDQSLISDLNRKIAINLSKLKPINVSGYTKTDAELRKDNFPMTINRIREYLRVNRRF